MENKKMNNSASFKWHNIHIFISLFFTTVLSLLSTPSFAGLVHGYVYTRTIVTNESGNYTWVEYNPATGSYVRDIGIATGDLDPSQWRAMSGNEYRGYVKQKSDLHVAQPDLVLMSRTAYETNPLLLADGNNMSKPGLGRATAYVSILPQIRRLIDDPASLILAEYPVNPEVTVAADILSMLHKYNGSDFGEIKDQTTNRIGFKTAFAKDEAGNPIPIGDDSWVSYSGNEAAGPIGNAPLEAWLFYGAVTDSKGNFVLSWPSIPCPLIGYTIDSSMLLKLQYQRFNPKGGSRGLNYYETHPMSEVCVPNVFFVPFFGPVPLGLGEIHTFPNYPVQFNLDLSVLSGSAQLTANVATQSNRVQLSGEKVLVGAATQYLAESPDNSDKITSGYDYDRDGTQDTVIAGHLIPDPDDATKKLFAAGAPEELQAVWLSSGGLTPQTGQPDLTRVMDSVSFANFTHQGLLSEISAEDLRNTDIYIVRVSDGKLISERIGLHEYDTVRSRLDNTFGEDTENDQFFYNIQMQGSLGDRRFITSSFDQWQSYSGINPDLHQQESDHVQPGDAIRIYAINRATGYMGHADTIMQAGSNLGDEKTNLANGDISFHIDPIIMGPPNLKIKAERGYKITSGITQSDDTITQLIGFEGASLTSDNTVTITTEWLDHEGRPMPESLAGAGYTGRIAVLSGDKTVSNNNQGVYQFSIDPGQRLQVLQLPNALTDKEHFYVHVSGEPQSGNPVFAGSTDNQRTREADFSSSGQNPGILEKRPDNYVPFLVAVFDEANTELQTQTYRYLKETNPEQFVEAPDPVYKWVYRPELQFTSYNLNISAINNSYDADESGTIEDTEIKNILDDESPLISSDSVIDILYGLSTTDLLPLDYFNAGSDKELVFVVGEQELTATLGADQTLTFDDLSSLDLLTPDDFFTIQLYANNDMGNILYEYAFPLLQQAKTRANLVREYSLGAFSDGNLTLSQITDSYQEFTFSISETSNVKLEIFNDQREFVSTLINEVTLPTGSYRYVVTYEDIASSGVLPRSTDDFYLKLTSTTEDGFVQKVTATGNINEYHEGRNLGQVVQHDVLIQDGSLSIQNQDIVLTGVGPQLSLSRSYSNKSSTEGVMGAGWSHNYDISLTKRAYGSSTGRYNIPVDVENHRGEFFTEELEPDILTQISVSNGGMFKRHSSGAWIPQLGNHGSLTQTVDGFDYRSKDGTLYHFGFSLHRQLVADYIEDRNGNRTDLTYSYTFDSGRGYQKRLQTVTDAIGRSLTFNYGNSANYFGVRLTSVTSSDDINMGLVYEYNNFGQLISASRIDDPDYIYSYNYVADIRQGSWNLASIIDPNNHEKSYDYSTTSEHVELIPYIPGMNAEDVVRQVNYPDSASHTFGYVATPQNQRTITDARGNATTYTLNNYGNPIQIDEPLSKTTLMSWSIDDPQVADNVMISKTDANGSLWEYEYDIKGNVVRETDPNNQVTISSWNLEYSLLTTKTDRNGVVITNTYDDNGNLIEQEDGQGYITTHTYNNLGLRISSTDARTNLIEYSYDDNGYLAGITKAEGSFTQFEYDIRGRLLSTISPNGFATTYEYDELDRLLSQTDPDGIAMEYTYDAKGNKLTEKSRLGLILNYVYDERDRVLTSTRSASDVDSATKIYTYDNNGNLETETDWKNVATTYTYDELNRRESVINRNSNTMSYEYDFVGNKTAEIDYENRRVEFAYDDLNRLTQTTYVRATDPDIVTSQTYDKEFNIITQTDAELRTTTYAYDGRYLKTSQTNALAGLYQWEYDEVGNLIAEENENTARTEYEYDNQNRRSLLRRTPGSGQTYETLYAYDDNDNLTSETDPRDNTQTSTYDELNRVLTRTDFDGINTTQYDYQLAGRVTNITDARSIVRTNTVDSLGRTINQLAGDGGLTVTQYDQNSNVSQFEDARDIFSTTTYDLLDRPTIINQAVGTTVARTLLKSYDNVGNVKTETDGRNTVTEYNYDELNRRTSQLDDTAGFNYSQSWVYNNVGKVTEHTNRRNNVTTSTYDNLHRLKTATDPITSYIVEYGYDAVGNVLTEKDKRNTITTHDYDDLNRLVSSSKASIYLVRNGYDGNNNVTSQQDANDNTTINTYTTRNQVDVITFADSSTQTHGYDEVGNLNNVINEVQQSTRFTYDNENRQASVTNFNSETTTYAYDLNGNQTQKVKPKGNTWLYSYDELNRLDSVTDGLVHPTSYEYDANNNQTAHVDAMSKRVVYVYDNLNRKTAHQQPGGLNSTYAYDANSNLSQVTDAKGQVFTYGYDDNDRETTRTYPAGSSTYLNINSIATVYDANNNVTLLTEVKTGTSAVTDITSMSYDLLDREETSTQRGLTVSYTYDNNGNRSSVSTPTATTTYTFDNRNRLETAVVGTDTTTYNYYADGKLDFVLFPNSTRSTKTYDNANRVSNITNTSIANSSTISAFSYGYDANGNRTSQVETQAGVSDNTTYVYDDNDRLTDFTLTRSDGTVQTNIYTLDDVANRLTETVTDNSVVSVNRTYNYDDNHWLSQITDSLTTRLISYSYDNNGNTINKVDNTPVTPVSTVFNYDVRDQLAEVKTGDVGSETNTQGQYDYNYSGMRVRHRSSERGDVDYFYDQQSVIEERRTDNSLLAHYRYADRLLSLDNGTSSQYYHHDALGSTTNLSDSNGNVQVSYKLDPWGTVREQTGTSENRQIFTGQEHDENTGLIYFGARYYDPDTARFITQDSYLGESNTPPSLHRYLYAFGNPTVYVDLDGHKSVFGEATKQIDNFKDWLSTKNKESDSHLVAVGVGTAKLIASLGQVITGSLDVAANVAQEAVGVDDQQVRDELKATRQMVTNGIDFAVNGDYGQAVKNAHAAAVKETTKAFAGDVNATSNITEVVIAAAMLKSKGSSRSKLTKENTAGTKGQHTKSNSTTKPKSSIDPGLQKRTNAYKKHKRKKGVGSGERATRKQFENFRRGNAGNNGQKLYPKRSKYKDPKTNRHGNTLDDSNADFYFMLDRNGNKLKPGISKNAKSRYSSTDLKGGKEVKPIWKGRSRKRLEKVERWFSERKDYPEDKTSWSGKRDRSSPNYDPDYIPKHMRK